MDMLLYGHVYIETPSMTHVSPKDVYRCNLCGKYELWQDRKAAHACTATGTDRQIEALTTDARNGTLGT